MLVIKAWNINAYCLRNADAETDWNPLCRFPGHRNARTAARIDSRK